MYTLTIARCPTWRAHVACQLANELIAPVVKLRSAGWQDSAWYLAVTNGGLIPRSRPVKIEDWPPSPNVAVLDTSRREVAQLLVDSAHLGTLLLIRICCCSGIGKGGSHVAATKSGNARERRSLMFPHGSACLGCQRVVLPLHRVGIACVRLLITLATSPTKDHRKRSSMT